MLASQGKAQCLVFQMSHPILHSTCLGESTWSLGGEDFLPVRVGNAMGHWKFESLGEQLLDVWSSDIVRFLNFCDFQDLRTVSISPNQPEKLENQHT